MKTPLSLTPDQVYARSIFCTLELVRTYLALNNISAHIKHIENEKFQIQWNTTFKMPDDEGGWYWETETNGITNYSWFNMQDALKWVLEQTGGVLDD